MTDPVVGSNAAKNLWQKWVLVQPGESRALLWAAAYFFFLLFSFYLLRPVREAMGIAKGADKLPWLMTATMLVMLLANPVYAMVVSRLPRRRFIPFISHFFALNLLIFFCYLAFFPSMVEPRLVTHFMSGLASLICLLSRCSGA